MIDHNKKFTQYLLKGQFKLIFKNQDCKYLITDMINNTTNVSWSNYIRDAIDKLKEEGYDFNYINLINKFPQNWRHPINTKFNCYRF